MWEISIIMNYEKYSNFKYEADFELEMISPIVLFVRYYIDALYLNNRTFREMIRYHFWYATRVDRPIRAIFQRRRWVFIIALFFFFNNFNRPQKGVDLEVNNNSCFLSKNTGLSIKDGGHENVNNFYVRLRVFKPPRSLDGGCD